MWKAATATAATLALALAWALVPSRPPAGEPGVAPPPAPGPVAPHQGGDALSSAWENGDYAGAEAALRSWLTRDPDATFRYVGQLKDAAEAQHYAAGLFLFLRKQPPTTAWALASELLAWPEIRASVVSDRFAELAGHDPDLAIGLLEEAASSDGQFATQLAYDTARNGALGAPAKAMEYLLQRPDGPVRPDLVSGCLGHWLATDSAGATAFLNTREPDGIFDRAAMVHSENIAHLDPEAALGWAQALVHPSLREEARLRVVNIWEEIDPEGFHQWITGILPQ